MSNGVVANNSPMASFLKMPHPRSEVRTRPSSTMLSQPRRRIHPPWSSLRNNGSPSLSMGRRYRWSGRVRRRQRRLTRGCLPRCCKRLVREASGFPLDSCVLAVLNLWRVLTGAVILQEIHPRLQRHVKSRLASLDKGGGIDWATAEVRGICSLE